MTILCLRGAGPTPTRMLRQALSFYRMISDKMETTDALLVVLVKASAMAK